MDKITTCDALADFDRWHAAEMRRIDTRSRRLQGVVLGAGTLMVALLAVAWFV